MIIDILQAMASRSWVYCVAYGGPINFTSFGNWFHAKYLRLQLLHHSFALHELYIITLFYVI